MDDIAKAMMTSASAMKAQGERMRVISENIANADTLPGVEGEQPYARKLITFETELNRRQDIERVEVKEISESDAPFNEQFLPDHPAADERGYVQTPNVNVLIETMDMREAQRSYEANLGLIDMSRTMLSQTVDLLR